MSSEHPMLQTLTVNGTHVPATGQTVRTVLVAHGVDPERPGIAIAMNGAIVPRVRWDSVQVQPGDRVEIVHALAGG